MIKCNLNVLLAERKMSIQDLADKTNLSRTTISALVNESGKGIQFDTMDTLCKFLGINPGELFSYIEIDTNFTLEAQLLSEQIAELPHEKIVKTFRFTIASEISFSDKYFKEQIEIKSLLWFDEEDKVVRSSFQEEGVNQQFTKFTRSVPTEENLIIIERLRNEIYHVLKETYNIDMPKKHIKNASSII